MFSIYIRKIQYKTQFQTPTQITVFIFHILSFENIIFVFIYMMLHIMYYNYMITYMMVHIKYD